MFYKELCKKLHFDQINKWYMKKSESIREKGFSEISSEILMFKHISQLEPEWN